MKKILPIALLLGAAHLASAGTTNIYVENWGSPNAISAMTNVGWNGLAVSGPNFTSGPYLGIYAAVNPTDSSTGNPLPANTVYFTGLGVSQTTPGMFYTTDASGPGPGGNSSFVDIDPTQYTNLSLSVEVVQQGGGTSTNYFAVQVGGAWYVSATALPGSAAVGGQTYSNNVMPYTNLASAWLTLSTNGTGVTIGLTPGANLSGDITGIGIVELSGGGGWNYNQLAITAFAPSAPPPVPPTISAQAINQTVYAGGGASFLIGVGGTRPLTYQWYTNSVALVNGSKYSGVNTNLLTISNCSSSDVVPYTVTITNVAGTTNSANISLTVNPVPPGWLYAETYPFIGFSGGNLPLSGVGWANASGPGTTVGIFQAGTGLGEVFDYSGSATTNLNYTTASNDVGQSGLPFNPIDPTTVPAVTFQAAFSPGNPAGTVAGNVTVYWAVQLAGSNWYASTHAIPINISQQNNYLTNQLGYSTNTAASNWDTMTVNGNSVVIGGQAPGPLSGLITGAGMVFVHPNTSGASMNWANFAIVTNAVSILAPQINTGIGLYSQSVPTGGGASFSVALSAGTLPITYAWSLNGVMLTNGGRISGATSPTVTIGNTTTNDTDISGGNVGNVIAYVSNSVGSDNSAAHFPVSLFVTNAPVGQLFIENFPYVGPSGNQPISMDGWSEAVPGTPNVVFEAQSLTGLGSAFAFLGSAGTTVYYTDTATDTNQAGLPYPSINPAFYPDLAISASIAPSFAPSNVTAYVAVQFGAQWYVATNPLPVPSTTSGTYTAYTVPFNGAAANWDLLTITGTGGLIGAQAANNLTGLMTGTGLVFKTVNTGGTFNFNNLTITGSGLGGINYSRAAGGGINLSWVGNPAVNLQTTMSLSPSSWSDVPNTLGAYSYVVSPTAPQQYFRLVEH